jgi:hypothetical protein
MMVAGTLGGCGPGGSSAPQTDARPAALTVTPGAGSRLAVLVPDGFDQADPRARVWSDAAAEEGLKLAFVTDAEFLNLVASSTATTYRGLILPDQIHQHASDELIAALTAYADAGGWLMIVYDFGVLLPGVDLFPSSGPSRLSALAGVDYVFYAARYPLGDIVGNGPIYGATATLRQLQVPPGKSGVDPAVTCKNDPRIAPTTVTVADQPSSPGLLTATTTDASSLKGYHHAVKFDARTGSDTAVTSVAVPKTSTQKPTRSPTYQEDPSALQAISGYAYGALMYPSYLTGPASPYGTANGFDKVLLTTSFGCVDPAAGASGSGIAAAQRRQGNGGVLFVNLSLGYLKGETDAMLLHGFLRYFGGTLLSMPRLSDHPSAVGGLVFNWHVDAAEALDPMTSLRTAGVWDKGPFSIHLTAGPDTVTVGDGLGLDVAHNPVSQKWIQYFLAHGHKVGSHGGWDHDIYGIGASELNRDTAAAGTFTFLDLLMLNKSDLEAVTGPGSPVVEYSAPEGNNPHWAMDWLESTNHVGYYFLGHTGTGPTRAYRPPISDTSGQPGELLNPNMWAFPLNPMGCYATFEEFDDYGVDSTAVTNWYGTLIDFVVKNRTSRLIYAHPPGGAANQPILNAVFSYAQSKGAQFRWYTMTDLARFEARRLGVQWVEGASGMLRTFEATGADPQGLKDVSWLLPKAAYSKPKVPSTALLTSDNQYWIVTATGGTYLKFTSNRTN